MKSPLLASIATLLLLQCGLSAAPLQQASINQLINDVKVVDPVAGTRAAKLQEIIKDDLGVKTGAASRAELLFQDNTLTRLGAETFFSFKPGTRDMSLQQGTMLLQVPKGRGGARIRAASVTASVTGTTIMLEMLPGRSLKAVVLEGELRLSINNRIGETLSLTPGKMIIMKPDARSLPDPVDVDLGNLVKTSSLVNPKASGGTKGRRSGATLPSMDLISKEITQQAKLKQSQGLTDTNLVILGKGAKVLAASDELLAKLENVSDARGNRGNEANGNRSAAGTTDSESSTGGGKPSKPDKGGRNRDDGMAGKPVPVPRPDWTATADATAVPGVTKHALPVPIALPSPYVIGGAGNPTTIAVNAVAPVITTGGISNTGTIWGGQAVDGPASLFLFGSTADIDAQTYFDANFGATDGGTFASGGVGVFRFSSLDIQGSPAITRTKGPTQLALIADQQITGTTGGGLVPTSGVRSFFLGTVDGPISLSQGFTISSPAGSGFRYVQLYSRGTGGAMTLDGSVNLPGADLFATAQQDLSVGGTGSITARRSVFTSGADLTLGGTVTSDLVQAEARNALTIAGTVTADRMLAYGNEITLSGAKVTTNNLLLDSQKASGQAIRIENSSELLSLLAATKKSGGTIRFRSAGGDITVNNSRVESSGGTIDIQNAGVDGAISLRNANLRSDVIKIGALGTNGQLLIGGGALDADSAIKLYATGSNGQVRFTDNVQLNGKSSKTIAGATVTIDNGKFVTVAGKEAKVFTDNANYTGSGGNGSTSGQFIGKGAKTREFSKAPKF